APCASAKGKRVAPASLGRRADVDLAIPPSGCNPRMLDEPIAMHARLLIDAIVRQTTVLIAQLATSGGVRAPLAHIANQVFMDLAAELDAQGVSRKVSADMFGMALRTYLRKIQRLNESSTDRGRSLWEAVLQFVE